MNKNELLKTLEDLHEHLSQAESIDKDAENSLRQITDDIRRLLVDDEEATQDSHSLAGDLRSAILSWEAEHPHVAQVIGKVADALSSLGI